MGQLLADAARPFRASPSAPVASPFAVLRDAGVNAFRMRMWNDPCADGRCNASEFSYANLTGVMQMARRCRDVNLTFVLDLHYSDWWADPPASSNGGVLWWERDEHGAYNSLFDAHYVARPALLQGFRDADATRAHEGASAVHERVNESV